MNLNDVVKIVQTTGLLDRGYSVGVERENQFIIIKELQKWLVYHFEKGGRAIYGTFDSEDAACRFYIREIADITKNREEFLRRMADDQNI